MARARGFTLIEMVVVVAIIVALAGILVPVVSTELEDSKRAEAHGMVNRIGTALSQFMRDTGAMPTGPGGNKHFHLLLGAGEPPQDNKFASGEAGQLTDFLTGSQLQFTNWRGPYLAPVGADPWGSAYLVNTHGFFNGKERVWILSAGPNRRIETNPKSTSLGGDDIGLFLD